MPDYGREKFRFLCRGVDLNVQRDVQQPEKYPRLENVRVNVEGVLEGRGGYTKINSSAISGSPSVHSGWRLNDKVASLFTRILGAGTALYRGTTSFSSIDTGYSGDPLSLVPYRPDQAAVPFIYIADTAKMRKVDRTNAVVNMGIAPPTTIPRVEQTRPMYVFIDDGSSNAGWATGGTATSLGTVTRQHKGGAVPILLQTLLFDRDGSSGGSAPRWAILGLGTNQLGDDIRPGMRLTIQGNGGSPLREVTIVEEVHSKITRIDHASGLKFDSGTIGWATVTVVHNTTAAEWDPNLRVNSFLIFDDTVKIEGVRVEEIITGPGGERCLRVFFTVAKAGYEAAAAAGPSTLAITSQDALRCFINSGSIVPGGGTPDELLQIQRTINTKTGKGFVEKVLPLDLSRTTTGISRTIRNDDIMHISLRVDDSSKIVEGRIEIDVAHTSVSGGSFTGSQFERNYYFKAFRGSDLIPALKFTQTITTTSSTQVQRRLLESELDEQIESEFGSLSDLDPQEREELEVEFAEEHFVTEEKVITTSSQIQKGESQWTELSFRVGELTRVGTDRRLGLDSVEGLRFTIVAVNAPAGSEIAVDFGSLYIRGGYGPDVSNAGLSYLYRMRARSKITGAVSNPGPPTRGGLRPFRDRNILLPDVTHSDSQVDTIDFFRFGGQIASQGFWYYIGSTPNSSSSQLDDVYGDLELLPREILDFDNDQPFTVVDTAKSGTCDVIGSAVTQVSGDTFLTRWAPGTTIRIAGEVYTLVNQPTSTTFLHLAECAVKGTGLAWQVEEPIILAEPLPYMWADALLGIFLAVGDERRPGYLYWTRGNNPDSAPGFYNQEVTNPSEPLMNGFNYGSRSFVASSERIHAIWSSNVGLAYWRIFETHTKRGFWTPWCFAVGPRVWYLSKDGIYEFDGQTSVSISDDDLYSIFPHGEQPGVEVNSYQPVDMTATTFLRMVYHNSFLYFFYKDTSGSFRCLVYDINRGMWLPDDYADDIRHSFSEVGESQDTLVFCGTTGFVYDVDNSNTDAGVGISGLIETSSKSGDDPQSLSKIGDVSVLLDRDGETITAEVLDDLGGSVVQNKTISSGVGIFNTIIDLANGLGVQLRDLALRLSWTSSTGKPKAHFWSYTLRDKPLERERRATDWHRINPNKQQTAYVRGIKVKVDTFNITKVISLHADQTDTGNNISIKSNGEKWLTFGFPPFRADEGRLVPDDAIPWQLFDWEWLFEDEPSLEADLDTNWRPATEDCQIGYVTGCVVVIDTLGKEKELILASEFEGVVTNNIAREAIGGSNIVNHNGRLTLTFTFEPFRAEQLRAYSTDGVAHRAYDICWIVHPEPSALANADQLYQTFPREMIVKGVELFADSLGVDQSVDVEIDGVVVKNLTVNHNGRLSRIYPIPQTTVDGVTDYPNGRSGRIFPKNANDIWIYQVRWIFDEEPWTVGNLDPKWTNAGYVGDKFVQGIILDANTFNKQKPLDIEGDNSVKTSIKIQHNGRQGIPYTFDPPFIAHMLRTLPTDDAVGRLYSERWVWEPIPEAGRLWETQETSFDLQGFMHIPDGFVALSSPAAATVTFDFITPTETITRQLTVPSGDKVVKIYLAFKANKFISCRFKAKASVPFRVYIRETELKVRPWNDPEAYKIVRPFGGMSRRDGATI